MAAPKGNEFWKARSSHGRNKLFASPDALWEACNEYFQWCHDNPHMEAKLVSFQGKSVLEDVPKMRALTIGGMCIFLDITHECWLKWRNGERPENKDFVVICGTVEKIIREQKFNGAAAGLLNPVIIARDIGLVEKTDHISSDGTMTPITKIERHVIDPKNTNA